MSFWSFRGAKDYPGAQQLFNPYSSPAHYPPLYGPSPVLQHGPGPVLQPLPPPLPPKQPEPCSCKAPGPYHVTCANFDVNGPGGRYIIARKEWTYILVEYARCGDEDRAKTLAAALNEQVAAEAAKGSMK